MLGDFEKKINADIHVITALLRLLQVRPGRCYFRFGELSNTLVTNHLKEVEVVMKSEAVLIKHPNLSAEKTAIWKNFIPN